MVPPTAINKRLWYQKCWPRPPVKVRPGNARELGYNRPRGETATLGEENPIGRKYATRRTCLFADGENHRGPSGEGNSPPKAETK